MDPNNIPISEAAQQAARIYLGVAVTLFTIALATITARIAFKIRSNVRLGLDDYLILIGFFLAAVENAVLTAAIAWAAPSSLTYATPAQFQRALHFSVVSIPIWGLSIGFIKISVACMLLRFQSSHPWRLLLYIMIALITVITIASCLIAVLQCLYDEQWRKLLPLAAVWDPKARIGAKCMPPRAIQVMSNFVGGFCILSDLILLLFPLTFILKLRKPRIEKLLIAFLMSVGLTAAAVSVAKAVYVQKWVQNPDGMFVGFNMSTLSTAEMLIGSIAACLPCLKSTVQDVLVKCGFRFERDDEDARPSFVRSGVYAGQIRGMEQGRGGTFGEIWDQPGMETVKPSSSESSKKSSTTEVGEGIV